MATLGKMSLYALISSSIDETIGLKDYLDGLEFTNKENKRWIDAYITSIRARLTVAEMKVNDLK
jgi:uncharacterized protein involved in exopolysaccharide biosynthesis